MHTIDPKFPRCFSTVTVCALKGLCECRCVLPCRCVCVCAHEFLLPAAVPAQLERRLCRPTCSLSALPSRSPARLPACPPACPADVDRPAPNYLDVESNETFYDGDKSWTWYKPWQAGNAVGGQLQRPLLLPLLPSCVSGAVLR